MGTPKDYKTAKGLVLQLNTGSVAVPVYTTVEAVNNINITLGEIMEAWRTVVSDKTNNRVVATDMNIPIVVKDIKSTPLTTKLRAIAFSTMQDRVLECRILDDIADQIISFDANVESLVLSAETDTVRQSAFTLKIADADSFALTPSDTVAPTVTLFNPIDGAAAVAVDALLEVTFDRTVILGSGNFLIFDAATDIILEAINVTSGNVAISGNTKAVVTHADYPAAADVYINIQVGAIKNAGGVDFAGIADKTTWNFGIA